jgi:hypothetical protein
VPEHSYRRDPPTAPRTPGGVGTRFNDLDGRSLLGAARPVLEDLRVRQDALDRLVASDDRTRNAWTYLIATPPLATVADYRLLARRFSADDQAAWEDVATARRLELIFFWASGPPDLGAAAALHARLDAARRHVSALAGLPFAPHCADRAAVLDVPSVAGGPPS